MVPAFGCVVVPRIVVRVAPAAPGGLDSMDSWMLPSPFRLCGALLALAAAPALAGVAGTGTATVTVDFLNQKLGVTAAFANQPGDLQNVNLGTLPQFKATGVSLTNVDVLTGASFMVPFTGGANGFR